MAANDGLLARVKPGARPFTTDAARHIAKFAARCGNGTLELTSRANLQVRGLTPASARVFADAVAEAGLAHRDPAVERIRNVIASPLRGWDEATHPATDAVASAIEDSFIILASSGLSDKFRIVVDGGGALSLNDIAADLAIRLTPEGCDVTLARCGEHRFLPWPAIPGVTTLAPAFGQFQARDLFRLADLAADGLVRLTPWRTVVLTGLDSVPPLPGWIHEPTDPRLRITACAGKPGCAKATVSARADAGRLAGLTPLPLHVAGCAKGCAHPLPSPITLVGRNGMYDVVRDGSADGPPVASGLSIDGVAILLASLTA